MRDFNQNDRGGSRGGGRRFDGGDRGPRPMHPATCSKCNKDCEVPFRPTGDKPVFCSDCFRENGGGERRFSDRAPRQSGPSNQAQFDEVNRKLDAILELLKSDSSDEEAEVEVEDDSDEDESEA